MNFTDQQNISRIMDHLQKVSNNIYQTEYEDKSLKKCILVLKNSTRIHYLINH